jgi:predicted Mrr-cat superfamily restriction endonuclease
MDQQAFVLRISPAGIDRFPEALENDQIIIGWAVSGLLDESLTRDAFRDIISQAFYADEKSLRKAGAAAGHMRRFIWEMTDGDLVVVPYRSEFYVAKVLGPAMFDADKAVAGTAYRRPVEWMNQKRAIPRSFAKSALVSRMKTQGTCASATDLLPEIEDCLGHAGSDSKPTFRGDLEKRLVKETLDELRSGRLDPFGFEHLIKSVLTQLGATDPKVVARSKDKGADVLATFLVAGAIPLTVAVQAKHWQAEPPVDERVVEQLIAGIEAEAANLGMVVTTGTISDDASLAAEAYFEEKGVRIELVDGEQFAKLLLEHGIGEF